MANLVYCPQCSPRGKWSRADCPACTGPAAARRAAEHRHTLTAVVEYKPVKAIKFTDAYRFRGPRWLRPLVRWANRLGVPWGEKVKDWTQHAADAPWAVLKSGRCIKCKGPIKEAPPGGVWGVPAEPTVLIPAP